MQVLNLHYIFKTPRAPVAVTYKQPQQTYPEHTHDVDEIVIVTSGQGVHTLNGNQFKVKRGDVFYVRAWDWHQFDSVENLHLFNILCRCTERPEQTVLPQYGYIKNPPKHWELRHNVLETMEHSMVPKLNAECDTVDEASACMINTMFTQVLTYLWRGRLPANFDGKRDASKQTILALMAYMDDRYAEDLTLDGLAERHGLSIRSLNRQFKEHTGLSPMHYLIQLRLFKAIERLRDTDKSITDVAFTCGFNDSNYFSYCFKKQLSISPSAFKKANNG